METYTENAKIASTQLGATSHGIFQFWIHCEGSGWSQGFGGWALDTWDEEKGRRVGIGVGLDLLMEMLRVVEKPTWESLVGTPIRLQREGSAHGSIIRIGHFTKDQWVDPKAMFAEARREGRDES